MRCDVRLFHIAVRQLHVEKDETHAKSVVCAKTLVSV